MRSFHHVHYSSDSPALCTCGLHSRRNSSPQNIYIQAEILFIWCTKILYLKNKKPWFQEFAPIAGWESVFWKCQMCVVSEKNSPLWVPTAVTLWLLSHLRHLVVILVAFQHHRISGLCVCSTLCMTTFKPPII